MPPANEVCEGCFYRPQRSLGKVMFLQVSVILLTGGCASVHAGIHTPLSRHPPRSRPPGNRHPPGADTPLGSRHPSPEHAGRYGQCAGGTHPTGMQSCYTGLSFCSQGGGCLPKCMLGYTPLRSACWEIRAISILLECILV